MRARHHYIAAVMCQTFIDAMHARGYTRTYHGWLRPLRGKERTAHRATWVHYPSELSAGNGDVVFLDPPDSDPRLAAIKRRAQELDMPVVVTGTDNRRTAA